MPRGIRIGRESSFSQIIGDTMLCHHPSSPLAKVHSAAAKFVGKTQKSSQDELQNVYLSDL